MLSFKWKKGSIKSIEKYVADPDTSNVVTYNKSTVLREIALNPQTAGVPYTEQNQLHGQQWEFRIQNKLQRPKNEAKLCKNDFI